MNKIIIILLTFFSITSSLFAHSDVESGGGFWVGLLHPVLGFDHLLAMISVGILSLQMGGKAIWGIPSVFVLIMLVGGLLGIFNIPFFSVEYGIALSVILLGMAIAIDRKTSPLIAVFFVGFFSLFHGHAHGTEMPSIASPVLYTSGFIVGTALIHMAGILIGLSFKNIQKGSTLLRHFGSGISGTGCHILILLLGV